MKPLLFAFPENEALTNRLAARLPADIGQMTLRRFPDGESYVRLLTKVTDRRVVLVCTLDHPDSKFLPLYFTAKAARAQGAKEVILLAPYLSYLRQDKIFQPGECLTSHHFAHLVSETFDKLITVDPHLHRINHLEEVYTIPTQVLHAAEPISSWIKNRVNNPVLIGPDSESKQWVAKVAEQADAPYVILEKTRQGDLDVEISLPALTEFQDHIPVLVDDIISTARTMIRTTTHLLAVGMQAPVCVGVHAIFAQNAYTDLLSSGVQSVITANTICHPSNAIDLTDLYPDCLL